MKIKSRTIEYETGFELFPSITVLFISDNSYLLEVKNNKVKFPFAILKNYSINIFGLGVLFNNTFREREDKNYIQKELFNENDTPHKEFINSLTQDNLLDYFNKIGRISLRGEYSEL